MSATEISLIKPKEKLEEILGSNSPKYWKTMRMWYKSQVSKDQFDSIAKELLGSDNIHVHNEFFLALLIKCQYANKPNIMGSVEPHNNKNSFINSRMRPPEGKMLEGHSNLSCQVKSLPDEDTITSQSLTLAWENDIDCVNADVVTIAQTALQVFLRNLMTECVARSKSYRVSEHNVPYGFNLPHATVGGKHLSSIITINNKDNRHDLIDGFDHNHIPKSKITLHHLIQALRRLPSKKLALMNIERAQNLLKTERVDHVNERLSRAAVLNHYQNGSLILPSDDSVTLTAKKRKTDVNT